MAIAAFCNILVLTDGGALAFGGKSSFSEHIDVSHYLC
jgi:hypothetical protein